jgi:hypothetical protein
MRGKIGGEREKITVSYFRKLEGNFDKDAYNQSISSQAAQAADN